MTFTWVIIGGQNQIALTQWGLAPKVIPVRRYVPIARPEIWEEEPYSARLRWHRAYIPRYYRVPLRYRIEMQEAGEIAADWKPVATDITTPDVTVNELSPRKDYNFRIRAELENGDLTEPTPPIQYHRSKVPMSKEPFALAEYKPVEYEHVSLNRSYVDHLTKYVPPRLPIDKPDMVVIDPETVELSWRSASVPESIRHSSNLTYTIEVRNPPAFDWRELISGLKVLNHKVTSLHNKIDYIFRIRAWNEYGCSEPSLPVSLYRPIDYDDYEYVDEDEEFEREWELRFGQQDSQEVPIEQVPPKLPIDTPKVNTQSDTTIWFSWIPARIPAYATQTPITYVVEIKEPPNTHWRRDVTGLVDCQYVREGLDPKRDYHIRVRAETEFGTSEPTLPIMIQRPRGSRPGSRRSSAERELKEDVTVNTSYLDNLTSTGPPRMTSNRPQISDVQPTSLTLSWAPSRVPSYVKSSGVSYIIEKREPPGHIWCIVARDVAETSYEVLGLNPEADYMFRVRAKNEHGISDPTLPVSVYRERDDYVPQKLRSRSGSRDSLSAYLSLRTTRRSSSIDYGSGSSGLKTPEEDSADKIPRQPEYIETTYDTQYGVEGKKGKITLKVKGYPLPTVHWYFGEEKLKYGDQFNAFITPAGGITLEIKTVSKDSVGEYKCYAENEHGASVKVVTFELADPPTVLEPLTDQVLLSYNNVTLSCKVDGYPNPNIKWMKDWKPLAESARIKIQQSKPEGFSIEVTKALVTDSGVYACVIENAAGKVTTACRLTVEETASPKEVVLKSTPIEECYTILEEVRRGEHAVTRRVIELSTGNSFEAQFIYLRNRAQKNFFLSEFEVLRTVNQLDNVLKIHDAFETERSLVFVTEPLPGAPLLEKIVADGNWTETDVVMVIRSLLSTLKEFETLRVLYLDMMPSNIRMCGDDGKDVKLVNFAMSRIQDLDEDVMHNYGTVGYASPEQITNEVLNGKTDTWGIGVLTYILLTGNVPFEGESDADVLNKTVECEINFEDKDFEKMSKKAQDFLKKLLIKQQSLRMSLDECMRHPWLKGEETGQISTDKLQILNNAEKTLAAARQVQTTAVLQSLSKIRHGTAALYQPAIDTNSGEIIFPDSDEYGDYLDEDAWYEWQLQYCDDPDSQYFPLMDKNFTVRESKHTAEKKKGEPEKEEPEEAESDGSIYFRNKIQPVTFSIGDDVSLMCTIVSPNDKPIVTWYRDETLLSEREAYRTEQLFSEETGTAQLIVQNAKDYDGAVYKCVARNKESRVSCEARLLLGEKPGKPGRPVVLQTSGSEAFLTWSNPVSDGNSYILGYRVDYRKQDTTIWIKGPYMTEEYALVSGLSPKTSYVFRVSCHNKYGTSPFSVASVPSTTMDNDAPAITVSGYLQPLLQFSSFTKQQLILPAESRRPSLSLTPDAKVQKGNPADFYDLGETLSTGKYGEYKLCINKTTKRQSVAKVMPFTKETHVAIKREFEILKNLRQLHIITVLDAYIMKEYCYVIFEHLSGLNVIQYLCLQKSYKEDVIARIVKQILDALQYLQMFGIVHLNLQPSSIAMATRRRPHVKLRDFTVARKVKDGKVENLTPAGFPDFVAPEVIKGETVSFPADMWSLGVLTFSLLSGVSPFGGADLKETLSNILFDRYKASDMYDNVTKESVKFINKLLRRLPKNRPTVYKCLRSRWLQLSDNMLNSRTTRAFPTEKLRDFMLEYTSRRADSAYLDMPSVPLEDLPKPTPGPFVQPILSDKVANRYAFKPKTTARMEREENEKNELHKPPVPKKPVKKHLPDEVRAPEEETLKVVKPTVPQKPTLKETSEGPSLSEQNIKKDESIITNTTPVKQQSDISKDEREPAANDKSKIDKIDEKKSVESANNKPKVDETKNTLGKNHEETAVKQSHVVVPDNDKKDSSSLTTKEDDKPKDKTKSSKIEKDIVKEEPSLTQTPSEIVETPTTKSIEQFQSESEKIVTENLKNEGQLEIKNTPTNPERVTAKRKVEKVSEDGEQTKADEKIIENGPSKDTLGETFQKPSVLESEESKTGVTDSKQAELNLKEEKSNKKVLVEDASVVSDLKEPRESKTMEMDTSKDVTDSYNAKTEIEQTVESPATDSEAQKDLKEGTKDSAAIDKPPVEEELIAPAEKSIQETLALKKTVLGENSDKDRKEEIISELSNVLVKQDKASIDEKQETNKEGSPEPILEDTIECVQKNVVESRKPEQRTENQITEEIITEQTEKVDDKVDSPIDNKAAKSEPEEEKENTKIISENKTSDTDENKEKPKGDNATKEPSEKEVITSGTLEQTQMHNKNEASTDEVTADTKEENRDSDDSEIQKLEKDAVPEKADQAKEEAKEEVTEDRGNKIDGKDSKGEEPNEENIADLCTAIDDALMFC